MRKQKRKVSNIMLVLICAMIILYTAADFALQYLADNLPSDSFNSLLDYLDVDSMSVEVLVKIFDVNKLLDIASGSSNKKLIEYICDHYDEFINVDKKKTIQTLIYHHPTY